MKHGCLSTVLDDISGNTRLMTGYLFGLLTKLIPWNNTTKFVTCCKHHLNKTFFQGIGEGTVRYSFVE